MSNDQMKIPAKIKVGYNKRDDTYTGKLAYVIYYDEKGKIRKEASWLSWCNKELGSDEFANEPTSGFVLNKKVGDYKSDWNHRMAHIRVYDPRGFEFEIGVENLLYILQECTSTKGKGLEGEFVYAWDKSDLVLLPVCSQEYVSSREFTDGLSKKVTKADMREGCVYITKKQETVIYLGKHVWFEGDTYQSDNLYKYADKGERHIFAYTEKRENEYDPKYFSDTGFTKLASKVSDVIATDYAEKFEEFKKSFEGAGVKEIVMTVDTGINRDYLCRYSGYDSYIAKVDDTFYLVKFEKEGRDYWGYNNRDTDIIQMVGLKKVTVSGNSVKYEGCNKLLQKITLGEVRKMEFYKLDGILHNNKHVHVRF
jgi:hypothetical protein